MSSPSASPSPLSPSSAEVAHLLRVEVGRLRRRLREVAALGELSPSQTSVLSRLLADGPAGTSDLAVAEGVRPQSMAATVAALVEQGMVQRRPDPTDGRRQLIDLTAHAHAYIAGGRLAREEWLTVALEERFTEPERATIREALRLLERISGGS